ncbi:amidohydrolase [Leucobacter sp. OLJS4]|uniref:metal-dependent hydrolase family protein n=1 Tax=unclassified Leucobacter TaxID=2621730 RepID=UPI000C18D416|nr:MULTISPECIES: amidohydrolase family protein [unclassified Leucobacter]PIJ48873.1 amidohydrolase [Leucobacter sp. OLES1]PII82219.1 amidohydrolase [Leucobacter sp. OLCALW19]PII88505.1 amidohydrolase [Leucobacter sp. OLTLW20]PII94189.1 amidohydrolase [Leucobacter sp. OLAS13]PII98239.1 amidohydrolase [Leucobacter sp. OLDS2]
MRTGSLNIVGAHVWDGEAFVDRVVHIVEGRVADGPAEGAETLDATGRWLVPGLIDAHFHAYATSMDGMENERGPLSFTAINGTRRLERALRRGFTTVRDVAGGDIGLARAIDADLFDAPRYHFTGPALSQTGGHGDPRAPHIDVCFSHGHMCEVVDGVENLRLAVRDRLRTGAHAIKIMTSGGVFSLADPLPIPQYSPEEVRVVTEEAKRRGSYVAAHAYSSEAVLHSIENGVRSIEHGNLIDSATAVRMAELDAFLVPTLAAYDAMDRRGAGIGLNEISLAKNAEVLSRGQEAVRIALAAGVRVGFGTDLMGDLEDDQLRGVRLQIEASGAAATLRAMTEVNAELIGDPALGHLGAGAYGDALLLSADPIEEPAALWAEDARVSVVRGGHVVA